MRWIALSPLYIQSSTDTTLSRTLVGRLRTSASTNRIVVTWLYLRLIVTESSGGAPGSNNKAEMGRPKWRKNPRKNDLRTRGLCVRPYAGLQLGTQLLDHILTGKTRNSTRLPKHFIGHSGEASPRKIHTTRKQWCLQRPTQSPTRANRVPDGLDFHRQYADKTGAPSLANARAYLRRGAFMRLRD